MPTPATPTTLAAATIMSMTPAMTTPTRIAAGHGGDELGPIDWRAWGAGLLGVGCSMLVAACLYVAVNAA